MTTRERKEAKLEKRLDWAASRDAKSAAAFDRARTIADGIPLGQPILVSHHSERHARADQARIEGGMARGVESMKMAEVHRSKAAGIEHQLETSIYSDDPDAVGQIRAKIAGLEAKRDRMKLVNKLFKNGDAAGLAAIGLDLDRIKAKLAAAGPYWGDKPHLPYELQNLGGNISRLKERIKAIEAAEHRSTLAEASSGGVLIEGETWVRVTFAEKPELATLDALKAAGFRWSAGSWIGEREKLPAGIGEGG